MKKSTKYLIVFFLLFAILKLILSSFINLPGPYSDFYIYSKMARSFFYFGNFSIHGVSSYQFPPLYSIFLSISYLFRDMNIVFFVMKFINVLLSSTIIFPAFLLAKEFLNEKRAFLFSILISVLPSNFSFSQYIMSENLFYPLFLFSIYFMYKSFTDKNVKFDVLSGLFIGLSIFTRLIGVVLIPTFVLSAVMSYFVNKKMEIKKRLTTLITSLIVLIPLLVRIFHQKLMGSTITLETSRSYTIESFLTLFVFYLAYYILSSGVIFFIFNLTLLKDILKKSKLGYFIMISFSTMLFSLIIMANHNSGRIGIFPVELFPWFTGKIIGRYADMLLPLILLGAFIVIFSYKNIKNFKYPILVTSFVLIFSSQIVFFSLYPPNNLSLSWLGFIGIALNYIFTGTLSNFFSWYTFLVVTLMFLLFVFVSYILIKKVDMKKVIMFFIVFFMVINLVNYGYNYYTRNVIGDDEQTSLGKWFNEHDYDKISNIVVDIRDGCDGEKNDELVLYCGNPEIQSYTKFGFWTNDNIKIADISNTEDINYVISTYILNYPIVYKTSKGIYVYKLK